MTIESAANDPKEAERNLRTAHPYYQDDYVTLYHADCLQHLDMLDQADVMVTDPPYGMAYQGFGGRKGEPRRATGRLNISGDQDTQARDQPIRHWGTKPALVFGKWNVDKPTGAKERLIWDKRPCGFMGNIKSPWGGTDEEIYVLGYGFIGKRTSNILSVPTLMSSDKTRPDHPTPKPVPLMEKLITACPESWTIIDPFAGSGSTLRAAKNLGRKCIGFEIDEKYCEITAQRLAQETLGIF